MLLLLLAISAQVFSQSAPDVPSILGFCGCFEVSFDFEEISSPNPDYQLSTPYHTEAIEWITLADSSQSKLVLQHILLVGDQQPIKHWRQDWLLQSDLNLTYTGSNIWQVSSEKAVAARSWVQAVYEVNDAPRYTGRAFWEINPDNASWTSETSAPLPRREYTHRSDYQIMQRTNTHRITPNGHVHEQLNKKVVVEGDENRVLAVEQGTNRYQRIEDSQCQAANDWWEVHADFWANARTAWENQLSKPGYYRILQVKDGKRLSQQLEALPSDASIPDLEAIIADFVEFLGDLNHPPR